MDIKNFYTHGPSAGGKPKQMVMLIHGLGANGQDLISLAPLFDQTLPEAVFVSPDAPFPCDMAPGMANSYQWFSLQQRDPVSITRGVVEAAPALENFIKAQLDEHDLPASALALLGFSQGTMMSLYVGPRYPEKIAGILGYSGALVGGEELIANPGKFHTPPVHLVHGEADTVVPVEAYHHAKKNLEKAGFEITGHTTPNLPHSIDPQGVESGAKFLKSLF